jgi:hypothetical protein
LHAAHANPKIKRWRLAGTALLVPTLRGFEEPARPGRRRVLDIRRHRTQPSGNRRDRMPYYSEPAIHQRDWEAAMHIGTLYLALALPLAAVAAPPEERTQPEPRMLEQIEVRPHAVITVDCGDAEWPTLQEVAQHNGISVFDPVAHVRHRIVIEGSRACRRGAVQVQVVFNAPAREVAVVRTGR